MLAAILRAVDALRALIISVFYIIYDLFRGNPCTRCHCTFYDDSDTFRVLQLQSTAPDYAARMIDTGVVGTLLKCDRCTHPRENHIRLARRRIDPECMPNGGAVLIELTARARTARRASRFSAENNSSSPPLSSPPQVQIEDLANGDGPIVKYGDVIQYTYTLTFASDAAFVEKCDDNSPTELTAGAAGTVLGVSNGIVGMRIGGTRKLRVPPEQAYGKDADVNGRKGETLVFEIKALALLS